MAGLMNIAQTGLTVAYTQLQTTGHNITNVNTPGYVRQQVIQESAGGQYTGGGFVGRGVQVVDVRRQYDAFLGGEVISNTSLAAGDKMRADQLGTLDRTLSDIGLSLGTAVDELRDAMTDVVNRPNDPAARTSVLRRADAVAERFTVVDKRLEELGTSAGQRITQSVNDLNAKLDSIAKLNQQIAAAPGTDSRALDLVDQREVLVRQVAEQMQVATTQQDDGTINLYSASGLSLVMGARASKLGTQPDPQQPARTQLTVGLGPNQNVAVSAEQLGSGSLGALMQFRDNDIVAARARLGQMAAAVAGAYNNQQAMGMDMNGATGAPMFALGTATSVASALNTGNAALQATMVDPAAVQASDYTVRYDGAQYRIERMSDGVMTTATSMPAVVDGLQLSFKSGAMAAGDTIQLQAASQFASGMKRVLASGSGIAAAAQLQATTGAANQGDVIASGFGQTSANANSASPVTLTFTSAGTFDVSGAGTGNPAGVAYTSGNAISYNGWTMTLKGTPKPGDTVTLNPTTMPSADNRNAVSMAKLGDQNLVGGTATFNGAFSALVADVGTRTAKAQSSADSSGGLLKASQAAFDAKSGVNLDEEAARLLQYQQSYQAAAKVLATAQSLFDSILNAVGR